MTLGLSTRAKKALAHLRVETPDQLRHHAGQMNAGVELCLISIPRCGWSTVIEIMEWCGEPLSHHAQMVADRVRRDERSASPAAALTEAQATIARLEAENARLRSLAPNPDETPDEALWRDYLRGVHPDTLAKQRKVTRERMRIMLRKIENRRAAISKTPTTAAPE